MTEQCNEATSAIDCMDAGEIVALINSEDKKIADAVQTQLPQIARAVELILRGMERGGRLLYFGAGTSGRLGVLDASECPPTFGVDRSLVQGVIAGGDLALRTSVEGAEDDMSMGATDVDTKDVGERDTVVGITAGGRAPYVLAALERARELGAATVGLCNVENAPLTVHCDVVIAPIVGPEVISGSTRMKAGTAQKMILNMLSTTVMIRRGHTYRNDMVDLRASNNKLRQRAVRMVMRLTDVDEETAMSALERCSWHVKTALAVLKMQCSPDEARAALADSNGNTRLALANYEAKMKSGILKERQP
jgi:N-acetylmuramic acid 6-phosphate etherase